MLVVGIGLTVASLLQWRLVEFDESGITSFAAGRPDVHVRWSDITDIRIGTYRNAEYLEIRGRWLAVNGRSKQPVMVCEFFLDQLDIESYEVLSYCRSRLTRAPRHST